jgi:RNA methyltransferase, TrmH family
MITSVHNPKIQAVRKLLTQAKERHQQGAFAVEGVRMAEEAMRSGWEAQLVLYTEQLDERGQRVVQGFSSRSVPVELVSESVMKALSETDTPQGLLVVLAQKNLRIPTSPHFLVILDGVRDPGNLGTILRSAAAAGVQALLLTPGCVDAWSPKVVRSAMGAHFRLPILRMSWTEIRQTLTHPENSMRIYLADSATGLAYTLADFKSPVALIVGGEAAGAGTEAASLAESRVHIPMPGGSESLNAAVAASLLLFEVVRQRAADNR